MTEAEISKVAEAVMDAIKPRWRDIAPPKNRDALLDKAKAAIRDSIGGEDEIQP